MGNIYNKIEFRKNLIICPLTFCGCPFDERDPYLFNKALKECQVDAEKFSYFRLYSTLIYEKIDWYIGIGGVYLQNNYPKLYSIVKKENDKSLGHNPGI